MAADTMDGENVVSDMFVGYCIYCQTHMFEHNVSELSVERFTVCHASNSSVCYDQKKIYPRPSACDSTNGLLSSRMANRKQTLVNQPVVHGGY